MPAIGSVRRFWFPHRCATKPCVRNVCFWPTLAQATPAPAPPAPVSMTVTAAVAVGVQPRQLRPRRLRPRCRRRQRQLVKAPRKSGFVPESRLARGSLFGVPGLASIQEVRSSRPRPRRGFVGTTGRELLDRVWSRLSRWRRDEHVLHQAKPCAVSLKFRSNDAVSSAPPWARTAVSMRRAALYPRAASEEGPIPYFFS